MDRPIPITGLGLVTPLGGAVWETVAALLAGRTIADRRLDLPDGVDAAMLAAVTGGARNAAFSLEDPAVILAERAAREALFDAFPKGRDRPIPVVLAASKGAVMRLLDWLHKPRGDAPEAASIGPHAALMNGLVRRIPALEPADAPVAACATSIFALRTARDLLLRGESDAVLVVAVESALHPVFVESYRRLGVLAPASPPQEYVGRPLDRERHGFMLNESAAAVVLQADADAPRATLDAVAVGAETSDSLRAPERFTTVERLVGAVRPDGPLVAVHPHATGTAANDEAELAALARALDPDASIPVYASKGAIGHPLGAAGLVNAVLAAALGRAGRIPPMPWIRRPIDAAFAIHPGGVEIDRGRHLIAAAGFGGHAGAAVINVL